ncbi:MAG: CBS domain protein [Candidatus Methanolliviera sp. GoM_asphalt]|nr:MAG: CBS domain protein [Candidatus Methanolliviera sp. GoM_asphalt]
MPEDYRELLDKFYEKKIDEIMEKRIWVIPIIERDAGIEDVIAQVSAKDHVWIVEDKNSRKLVGVITEKDFLDMLEHPKMLTYEPTSKMTRSLYHGTVDTAESIMTKKPIACDSGSTVENAITTMIKYNIRRLVVTEDGDIIGEISLKDLIGTFASIVYQYRR